MSTYVKGDNDLRFLHRGMSFVATAMVTTAPSATPEHHTATTFILILPPITHHPGRNCLV
ncbi:hypothetical protein [Nocardiopsis rhodophaea]